MGARSERKKAVSVGMCQAFSAKKDAKKVLRVSRKVRSLCPMVGYSFLLEIKLNGGLQIEKES